jgi:alkanesulfonate monooxygenase SsuD/methylene tetrahydromethanopterin reductase-like flavin-dependent oxidoreductase (luciferase family)
VPVPTFGILHDFRQALPWSRGMADHYAECIAEVEAAERLGFEAVWLSEHHATGDGFLPAPLIVAAALAARTERIAIGTNVLVLPLHHPLRVAEDAAVVDLLAGGRVVLGVGQGYAAHEFELFGVDRATRARRLEDGVATIRSAWEDGPVSPRPDRRIPILVGAVADRAVERAVRIGDGLIVYCGSDRDLPPRAEQLDRILAAHGRTRDGFRFVATGIVHVDEDGDRAWRRAAPAIAYLEGELAAFRGADRPTPRQEDHLVGTPDEVADRLAALHAATGFDHFAHWARLPGLDHEQALASLRLFAERVLPRVRGG